MTFLATVEAYRDACPLRRIGLGSDRPPNTNPLPPFKGLKIDLLEMRGGDPFSKTKNHVLRPFLGPEAGQPFLLKLAATTFQACCVNLAHATAANGSRVGTVSETKTCGCKLLFFVGDTDTCRTRLLHQKHVALGNLPGQEANAISRSLKKPKALAGAPACCNKNT